MGSVSRRIRNNIRQKVTGSRRPRYMIRLRPPHPGQPTPRNQTWEDPPSQERVGESERWWQRFLPRSR